MCILADGTIIDTNRIWQEMLACWPPTAVSTTSPGILGGGRCVADRGVQRGPGGPGRARDAHRTRPPRRGRRRRTLVEDAGRPCPGPRRPRVGDLENVTGRTRTHENVRRATRDASRLVLLTRHMDDAVFIADASGVIEWVNPAFVQMTDIA